MFKKLTSALVVFGLAFATIGASPAPHLSVRSGGSAADPVATKSTVIQAGETVDFSLGNNGIYMPKSAYTGTLELSTLPVSQVRGLANVRFSRLLVEFQIRKLNSEATFSNVLGLNYIYFELTPEERAAYNSGELAIYYFNQNLRQWVEVPTYLVNRGPDGRAAAVATNFGIYGLGQTTEVGQVITPSPTPTPVAAGVGVTHSTNIIFGQNITFGFGRLGVFLPKSAYTGQLQVTRLSPDQMPAGPSDIKFYVKALDYQVEPSNGLTTPYLAGLNYVYFDINGPQMKAYQAGELTIYHYNPATSRWEQLPTYQVSITPPSGSGIAGRVKAVAPGFGLYALGTLK